MPVSGIMKRKKRRNAVLRSVSFYDEFKAVEADAAKRRMPFAEWVREACRKALGLESKL